MNKIMDVYKKIWKKFPITLIITGLLTIYYLLSISELRFNYNDLLYFLMLSFGFSFLLETIKAKKKYYIVLGIVSIGLAIISNYNFYDNFIKKVIAFTFFSSLLIGLFYNYQNSKKSFNEYLLKVFIQELKVGLISLVILIGVLLLDGIFSFLITNFSIIDYVFVLLVGVFIVPFTIDSFSNDQKLSSFVEILITKVLFTLCLLAIIIIYVYLLKIIMIGEMPSNEIYSIILSLLIVTIPVSLMMKYYKNKDLYSKINDILNFVLIPLILLQTYSLLIRIIECGITPTRYIGIIVILLEVSYLVFCFIKKDIGYLLYGIVLALFISLICPFINMTSLSYYSQKSNLNLYYKDNLSNSEMRKVYGAYLYLKDDYRGEKIVSKLKQEDVDKILTYKNKIQIEYETLEFHDIEDTSIVGYNHLREFSFSRFEEDFNLKDIELEGFNYNIHLDMENLVNGCLENKDNIEEYGRNHNVITYKDVKIIIKYMYVYMEDGKTVSININGFILEK